MDLYRPPICTRKSGYKRNSRQSSQNTKRRSLVSNKTARSMEGRRRSKHKIHDSVGATSSVPEAVSGGQPAKFNVPKTGAEASAGAASLSSAIAAGKLALPGNCLFGIGLPGLAGPFSNTSLCRPLQLSQFCARVPLALLRHTFCSGEFAGSISLGAPEGRTPDRCWCDW